MLTPDQINTRHGRIDTLRVLADGICAFTIRNGASRLEGVALSEARVAQLPEFLQNPDGLYAGREQYAPLTAFADELDLSRVAREQLPLHFQSYFPDLYARYTQERGRQPDASPSP